MMRPRQTLLIFLACLALREASTQQCQNSPNLNNGQVISNGVNKMDYKYVCNTGFRLTVTTACRRGNFWTTSITCEEILCQDEPIIVNGKLDTAIDSRRVGAKYNLKCDSGTGKVVCNEFGKWDVGECEILCQDEVIINNGSLASVIDSRSVGAEYNIACDSGFIGKGKVVCNALGKWDVDGVCECINLESSRTIKPSTTVNISTENECTEECGKTENCSYTMFSMQSGCVFYVKPLIAKSIVTNVQECINACDADNECKLLEYYDNFFFGICFLFNTNDITSLKFKSELVLVGTGTKILGKDCPLEK